MRARVLVALDVASAMLFAGVIRYWGWRTKRPPRFEPPFQSAPMAEQTQHAGRAC